LTGNGTQIVKPKAQNIVIKNLAGEIHTTYHFKRENLNYIFYTSVIDQKTTVKVARSNNGTFGPYEINKDSLLTGDIYHLSVVENFGNDVLVYGSKYPQHNAYALGLVWEAGWPKVIDFSENAVQGNVMRPMGGRLGHGENVILYGNHVVNIFNN